MPLSLGPSSTTLLHVLDQYLRTQLERTSRTAFEIRVLIIEQSVLGDHEAASAWGSIKQKYTMHSFSVVSLEDVFDYVPGLEESSPFFSGSKDLMNQSDAMENSAKLRKIVSSISSATSQEDLITILRTRLIVEFAKQNGCESILWGDSTTRLAERTLAEAAKGRGFSLPWQTTDGHNAFDVTFKFPMREVLRKEIKTYATLAGLSVTDSFRQDNPQKAASAKGATVDNLMAQYFASVEENYPSIVSNVVRTSNRLVAPSTSTETGYCAICNLPIESERQGLHGWGGDQKPDSGLATIDSADFKLLCYGCARSTHGAKELQRQT